MQYRHINSNTILFCFYISLVLANNLFSRDGQTWAIFIAQCRTTGTATSEFIQLSFSLASSGKNKMK
jgi:hypothetical protein